MLDKSTPSQGMMNGDEAATGGNKVSLLNRGKGPASAAGGGGAEGNLPGTSRGPRRWGAVVIGVVLVLVLVIIGVVVLTSNDDQPAPGPTPTPSSIQSSSSASPTAAPSASPEEAAASGATAGYKAWRSVQDRVAMSGGGDATESLLASVATGKELDLDRFIANTYYKARGRKMTKPGVVVSITPTSIGTPGTNGIISAVTLTVCRDVSKAVILQNGKPTSTSSSPTHLIDTAKMTLIQSRWKAVDVTNKPAKGACK
jgi:hypothetical protein